MRYLIYFLSCLTILAASPTDRDIPVSVRWYGAIGNGSDQTAALNASLAANRPIYLPKGDYIVDCTTWVNVPSNAHIIGSKGTRLIAKANAAVTQVCFRLFGVTNVIIENLEIVGDTVTPAGNDTVGIRVMASTNIFIKNVTVRGWKAEGISIQQNSENVRLEGVVCTGNIRNGMALTGCRFVKVFDSEFSRNAGSAPECGVDVEPDATYSVSDVEFSNCKFDYNNGNGLYNNKGVGVSVDRITIGGGCVARFNQGWGFAYSVANGCVQSGGASYGNTGGLYVQQSFDGTFSGMRIAKNTFEGVMFEASTRLKIDSSMISSNGYNGVLFSPNPTGRLSDITVQDNTIEYNGRSGVHADSVDRLTCKGNHIFESGRYGIVLVESYDSSINGNDVIGSSASADGGYNGIQIGGGCNNNSIVGNMVRHSPKPNTGMTVASGADTITLTNTAVSLLNYYTNMYCYIPATGDMRPITGYTVLNVATVSPNWSVAPTAGMEYRIRQLNVEQFGILINANAITNFVTDNDLEESGGLSDLGTGTVTMPGNKPGSQIISYVTGTSTFIDSVATAATPNGSFIRFKEKMRIGSSGGYINTLSSPANFDNSWFAGDTNSGAGVAMGGLASKYGWLQTFGTTPLLINPISGGVQGGSVTNMLGWTNYGTFHLQSPDSAPAANGGFFVGDFSLGTGVGLGDSTGNYGWIQSFGAKPLYINSIGNNVQFGDGTHAINDTHYGNLVVEQGAASVSYFHNTASGGELALGPGYVLESQENLGSVNPIGSKGFIASNTYLSTAGQQQNSPAISLYGQGWGVASATSQSVGFGAFVSPTAGAVTPTGSLDIYTIISNTAPVKVFGISSASGWTGTGANVFLDNGTFGPGGGGGGGNMTNSGASVVGMVPVATDTTGTQWTPTNAPTFSQVTVNGGGTNTTDTGWEMNFLTVTNTGSFGSVTATTNITSSTNIVNNKLGIGTSSPAAPIQIHNVQADFYATAGWQANGESPAGVGLYSGVLGMTISPDGVTGTAGKSLVLAYYDGSTVRSALEYTNTSSGFTTVTVAKSGGDMTIGSGFRFKTTTSTPTGAECGAGGCVLWNSNAVLYATMSANGSTVLTTLLANHP